MASKWNTPHSTDGPPEQRREKQCGRNNFSISYYAEDGSSWKMETTRGKNPTPAQLKQNLTDALDMLNHLTAKVESRVSKLIHQTTCRSVTTGGRCNCGLAAMKQETEKALGRGPRDPRRRTCGRGPVSEIQVETRTLRAELSGGAFVFHRSTVTRVTAKFAWVKPDAFHSDGSPSYRTYERRCNREMVERLPQTESAAIDELAKQFDGLIERYTSELHRYQESLDEATEHRATVQRLREASA